jgi:hypothetical protein
MRKRKGMWNPATRIRFRRNWEMYDLFVGFKTRLVREEEDDIVGSLVYCFSGGKRPIGDGVGRRGRSVAWKEKRSDDDQSQLPDTVCP